MNTENKSIFNLFKEEFFSWHTFGFAIIFNLVFLSSFVILYMLGFVPISLNFESISDSSSNLSDRSQTNTPIPKSLPTRIVIESIGIDSYVSNPIQEDISYLDEELKKGAVRYPGSGYVGEGNMFIFGHSTGIKVVNNQAYKTFNNLKNLKSGGEIKIYSDSKLYLYKVRDVSLVDSNKAFVDLTPRNAMLTLSTCNTFGEKQERYVIEADFVGKSN
ncbi:MAG: sortase [Candidatus Paceibacterota bacterium]